MQTSWLERQLYRSVPFLLVLFLAVLAILGMIGVANLAVYKSEGGKRGGQVGEIVLTVSRAHEILRRLRNADQYLRIHGNLHLEKSGFEFSFDKGSRPDAGYLLLSRYDGDLHRSIIEFWDLNRQILLHTWLPPISEMNEAASGFRSTEIDLERDRDIRRFLVRHPVLTPDGGLLVSSRTPLTKIGVCSQIVWINDQSLFHHATEMDEEGNTWTSTKIEPPSIPFVDPVNFLDDAITKVSADGEILFQRSVSALFLDHGLDHLVYNQTGEIQNPIHLNDVQPVLEDGLYWKSGDVFLSLRSPSMIILYRPSTDEILWMRQGPWLNQHDVDILDETRVSVFDNHSGETFPYRRVLGNDHSDIVIYDFQSDSVSYPWSKALQSVDFVTETEGLHTIRRNGNLFVEEQNRGRMLEIDPDGNVVWEFVNRASDGYLYRLAWSRVYETSEMTAMADLLTSNRCPNN